jgi:L-threonylcarbamoyladenylate synthase
LLGDHPRLLRPGSITAAQLSDRLCIDIADLQPLVAQSPVAGLLPAPGPAMLAPGMMREHYAPTTPLVLLRGRDHASKGACDNGHSRDLKHNGAIGRIAFEPLLPDELAAYARVETLSERGDLEEVARHLFAALRRLDAAGLSMIHCDTCPAEGLGQAIMDRLERAAARTQPSTGEVD